MPKYYCEYCDIYLTHSSPGGRRQHNAGRKHINNKIDYFFNLIRDPKFTPPAHILEMGVFGGGMNFMMHGGARQPLMSHNMAGPAILRPPPMAQMPPWGGPVMMGRGMPPMAPVNAGAPPMMMPGGRGAPNFMMPYQGFRPRPFDRPQR